MRVLIFNSGLGSRLGALTEKRPKCMVGLPSGETIFHRQLRVLSSLGLRDFVVTTGPYPEQLEAVASEFEAAGCRFAFVRNDRYDETNYIHSLWLARESLRGQEVLMLHGDLVFDAAYVAGLLALPAGSYGSVDPELDVPQKDFSADIGPDATVRKVGVGIVGERLVAFQALYRLTPEAMGIWLDEVARFEGRGETSVYAENAANNVFGAMRVEAHSYSGHLLEEVDTPEDLARVGEMARRSDYDAQPVFCSEGGRLHLVGGAQAAYGCADGICDAAVADGAAAMADGSAAEADAAAAMADAAADAEVAMADAAAAMADLRPLMGRLGMGRPLVVSDGAFERMGLDALLSSWETPYAVFGGVVPNPTDSVVEAALAAFMENGCDSLMSVGGGSAIDVAKCVKAALAAGSSSGSGAAPGELLLGEVPYSALPHMALPTTAGTGSESTHFAVCYVGGTKRSVASDSLLPSAAVLVPATLETLPPYQRASTWLDAFCQAVESHWSRGSSAASRTYSAAAVSALVKEREAYFSGDAAAAARTMVAANRAGKAINLTTTTAPHAMSYKLTSLYGISHGHAVALCMPGCWRLLAERGDGGVQERLGEVARLVGGEGASPSDAICAFEAMLRSLGGLGLAARHPVPGPGDLDVLVSSVDPRRLSNFPLDLAADDIRRLYESAFAFDWERV